MRRVIALMLLAAAVPASAAEQFDLVCKGERRWSKDGAAEPVEARYKVDAAARKWCRDDCFEVASLATAATGRLIFKIGHKQDETFEEAVDPDGANWVDMYEGPYPPGDYWAIGGKCIVEPFTGLKR